MELERTLLIICSHYSVTWNVCSSAGQNRKSLWKICNTNLPVQSRQKKSFLPLWACMSYATLTMLFSDDGYHHCKTLNFPGVGPQVLFMCGSIMPSIIVGSEKILTVASRNDCWINLDQRTLKGKKLKRLAKDHLARPRTKSPSRAFSIYPQGCSHVKKRCW